MTIECILPDQVEFENINEIYQMLQTGFDQVDADGVIIDCEAINQVNSLLLALLIDAINQSRVKGLKLTIKAVPEALYGFCGDADLVEIIRQFAG